MTKLKALKDLSRKQLRALIAILVAVCVVVPSMVFAGLHAKADTATGVQKDAEGLTTVKTVSDTPDADGNYTVTIEAYNTQYELTTYPTDTVLVLERSSEMSKTLYPREKTNLETFATFTYHNELPIHNALFDPDNPDNRFVQVGNLGELKVAIGNQYEDNKYIKDPNNPDVYLYLCQTYKGTTDNGGFLGATRYFNNYKYSITDTNGNIYETDADLSTDEWDYYKQQLTATQAAACLVGGTALGEKMLEWFGSNIPSLTFKWKGNVDSSITTRPAGAKESFTITDFYTRDSTNDNATNEYLYDQYVNHGGLFIKDNNGEFHYVKMEPDVTNNGTRGYYKYTVLQTEDPNSAPLLRADNTPFVAYYGNPVYGAHVSVFQGFKTYIQARDKYGNPLWEDAEETIPKLTPDFDNSLLYKTLYNGEHEEVTRLRAMQEAVESFILNVYKSARSNGYENTERIGITSYASKTEWFNGDAVTTRDYDLTSVYSEDIAYDMIKKVYSYEAAGRRRIDTGMEFAHEILDRGISSSDRNTHNVNIVAFTAGVPSSSISNSYELDKADFALAERKNIENNYAKTKVYTVGLFENADANELYGKYFYRFSHDAIPCDGTVGKWWGGTYLAGLSNSEMSPKDAPAMNRFLNYLSSNFSSANYSTSKDNRTGFMNLIRWRNNNIGLNDTNQYGQQRYKPEFWSTGGYGYKITKPTESRVSDTYYYATHDSQELSNAFLSISEQVVIPNSILDEDTVIKDYVTQYFQNPTNIEAYTMQYTGSTYSESALNNPQNWTPTGDTYEAHSNGKAITVTGFDYADHYVASDNSADKRQKLVLTFMIKPVQGFMGGNYIPTNEKTSGISDKNESFVENFPIPHINIEPNSSIAGQDLDIYYSEYADLFDLFTNVVQPDGINNGLVDVQYVLTKVDGEGEDVARTHVFTYSIYAGDTTGSFDISGDDMADRYPVLDETQKYELTCIVTPITPADPSTYGGYDASTSNPLEQYVYVYCPRFTEEDTRYTHSEAENPGANVVPEIEWFVVKEDGEEYTMSEDAPDIYYTINDLTTQAPTPIPVPEADESGYSIEDDTDFQVVNVHIDGYSYNVPTYYEYYVLDDGTISDVRPNDDYSNAPANAAVEMVEKEDGSGLEPATDEDGHYIYITRVAPATKTVTVNTKTDSEGNRFVTYVTLKEDGSVDTTRTLGEFTKFVGAIFDMTVQKQYDGDYANPETTTIVVTDGNAFSETVTYDPTVTGDFISTLVSKTNTLENLRGGVEYTITETAPINTNGKYEVSVEVVATPVDGTPRSLTVSENNGSFTFTTPDEELDSLALVVTNLDLTNPVITGVSEDQSSFTPIIILGVLAVMAGAGGVYFVYRKNGNEA